MAQVSANFQQVTKGLLFIISSLFSTNCHFLVTCSGFSFRWSEQEMACNAVSMEPPACENQNVIIINDNHRYMSDNVVMKQHVIMTQTWPMLIAVTQDKLMRMSLHSPCNNYWPVTPSSQSTPPPPPAIPATVFVQRKSLCGLGPCHTVNMWLFIQGSQMKRRFYSSSLTVENVEMFWRSHRCDGCRECV